MSQRYSIAPRGFGVKASTHYRSRRSAREREAARHTEQIVARVRAMHPDSPAAQRRALTRWAGILWANDRAVAVRLLEVRPSVAGRAA